jgi:pyrroline-5-carboxylate reductase
MWMSVLSDKRLAVIGAGNIGRILIERLLAVGVPPGQVAVCDIDPLRGQEAAARYGVPYVSLTDEGVNSAGALLIATPPMAVADVLASVARRLRPGQVIVSFAAIVPLEKLAALVPPGVTVVRVMPNAPSLLGEGLNPVSYGDLPAEAEWELVNALLAALGKTVAVSDTQMNWCVGLTGAAMRSLLPVLEGMTQAGIEAGFSNGEARQVAAAVMRGTAELILQRGLTWTELKALTPMQTVDEVAVSQVFYEAARTAKEKMDGAQLRLWPDSERASAQTVTVR